MEQRLQKRVAKNLLARIILSSTEFFGYVMDLAKAGLGFTCNRELEIGSDARILLNVPGQKTMELIGKIAWTRSLPALSKNRYQYGLVLSTKPELYDEYVEALMKKDFERRSTQRFQAMIEVQSDDVLDLLDAATEDVSAAGLYIRTGRPLTVGAQYEIALASPEFEESLRCLGEVVAVFECEPDSLDHPYGAGIRIISFVGADGELFKEFIKSLESLYKFHWPEDLDDLLSG